jgi:hypothetical protein
MKKLIIVVAVLVVAGGASALAQSRNKNNMGSSMGSSSDSSSRPSVEAPIGHRQPRAGDVPDEKNLGSNDSMSRDDLALDRKIKSICRGC